MHRRQFFGLFAASLLAPAVAARAEEGREEFCEQLDREERELRERLDHERDPRDRDEIERRLREIVEQRERDCFRR
ncbi:MAG TPA: hypothetical protein VEI03_04215 [Stellaceae bacterium]|nr:hypothetical protein [Stellaceae bacterium]